MEPEYTPTDTDDPERRARLASALRRVVLLKETGPKSAAWHRARVQTIWRLHKLLDAQERADDNAQTQQPAGGSTSEV